MTKVFLTIIFCVAFLGAASAVAMEESDSSQRTLADYVADYVDVPKGGTDRKVFSKTKEMEIKGRDADGMDYEFVKPAFPPQVQALDGKTVTVKGFMFPLESEEAQKLFLLGPFPVSCPYHYHVTPSMVIEVHADKKPVKFTYDPITVTGTLRLVPQDFDTGVFYRLEQASML